MNNENKIEALNFASHKTPLPIEVVQGKGDDKYVLHGVDNLYSNFLLRLFNESPLHKGIINSKVDYIIGEGVYAKQTGEKYNPMVNSVDTLEEFIQKVVNDYVIFNYFTVEVAYSELTGLPVEYIHIPAHQIRSNRSRTKFWYCDDWYANSRNTLTFDRWTANYTEGTKRKVFFYSNYTPSVNNVYPSVEYSGAIKSLETDIAIRDFHLNNITNHFSVSTLLTVYGGILTPEQKSMFEKKLTNAHTGTNGNKLIIDYQTPDGKPSEVKNIGANDWDKAYDLIKKSVEQDILAAHSATSPLLFGIKTEGALGGTTELETAYEIFKNLYVKNRRNELEAGLNKLFTGSNISSVEFKDKGSLFSQTISDDLKEKIMTKDELRESAGLPKLEGNSNSVVARLNDLSPIVANKVLATLTQNEIRGIAGLSPVAGGDAIAPEGEPAAFAEVKEKGTYFHLSDEDFEKIKHLGTHKNEFDFVDEHSTKIENFNAARQFELAFDDDSDITNYLMEKEIDGKTVAEIRADIKKELAITVTAGELEKKISELVAAGIISSESVDDKIKIKPIKPAGEVRKVEVLYSYEGVKDDRNRPFCAKLKETERLYSREEIQIMSATFQYSIWDYRGGFYHNPETGVTTPYCRHSWFAHKVVRKGGNN